MIESYTRAPREALRETTITKTKLKILGDNGHGTLGLGVCGARLLFAITD